MSEAVLRRQNWQGAGSACSIGDEGLCDVACSWRPRQRRASPSCGWTGSRARAARPRRPRVSRAGHARAWLHLGGVQSSFLLVMSEECCAACCHTAQILRASSWNTHTHTSLVIAAHIASLPNSLPAGPGECLLPVLAQCQLCLHAFCITMFFHIVCQQILLLPVLKMLLTQKPRSHAANAMVPSLGSVAPDTVGSHHIDLLQFVCLRVGAQALLIGHLINLHPLQLHFG